MAQDYGAAEPIAEFFGFAKKPKKKSSEKQGVGKLPAAWEAANQRSIEQALAKPIARKPVKKAVRKKASSRTKIARKR